MKIIPANYIFRKSDYIFIRGATFERKSYIIRNRLTYGQESL